LDGNVLLSLIILLSGSIEAQQRETIPEAIAKGAVGSVATAPSGQLPSVADLLRITDVVARGTIGPGRSYLSDDQRDVYTDYPITEPIVIYQSNVATSLTPGTVPSVTVTVRGGTVVVNGTTFTHTEPGLRPLQAGTQGLFLLQRVGSKYRVAGTFFGAFSIKDGKVMPLAGRSDFAPEYRDIALSDAVKSMMTVLHGAKR
jgi:hypothetical protein